MYVYTHIMICVIYIYIYIYITHIAPRTDRSLGESALTWRRLQVPKPHVARRLLVSVFVYVSDPQYTYY